MYNKYIKKMESHEVEETPQQATWNLESMELRL
jgi:hypothetical protein